MDDLPQGPASGSSNIPSSPAGSTSGTAINNNGSLVNADTPGHQDTHLAIQNAGVFTNITHTLSSSLKWCPTSERELAEAESDLLSALTRPFKSYFVDIGAGWGLNSIKIRTLEMLTNKEIDERQTGGKDALDDVKNAIDQSSTDANQGEIVKVNGNAKEPLKTDPNRSEGRQPLLLVHGFGSGIGTWILNLDPLASTLNRKIYAIDLLGFARSTRAPFDLEGDVEGQFVDSIERWRAKMGIEKFVLLGHSFGGYLSASYALKHPDRVSHVILADPWGIQDRQAKNRTNYRFPMWVRIVTSIFQHFNPLAVLRVTGPYGPTLVHKFRGDLKEKFRSKLQDDCHKFLNYIYHCNAQTATGESAFKALALPYGWPKNPLIHRLLELHQSVTLTFIYGSRSWIDKTPGEFLRGCLGPDRVTVNEIEGSGHHVYADKYNEFNEIVLDACSRLSD